MVIFHSYVSVPEGTVPCSEPRIPIKNESHHHVLWDRIRKNTRAELSQVDTRIPSAHSRRNVHVEKEKQLNLPRPSKYIIKKNVKSPKAMGI